MALQFGNSNKLLNKIFDFYLPNNTCVPGICKGATELCEKYCYGNGVFRHSDDPDKQMLNTEAIARENYRISLTDGFVDEMNALIKQYAGISRIRIHSIGDFYSTEYFLKWINIIKSNPNVQFTAYVKNFDVLADYMGSGGTVPDNFNVLLSIYPDTYDRYESKGGKQYIDDLFSKLMPYYRAKIYTVCSKEFFYSKIQNPSADDHFCSGGTEMLCKYYGLDNTAYTQLFVPGQSCDECLKCYSDSVCPKGSNIYAVLRASSNLANLRTLLNDQANKERFKNLRKMFPNEI